MKNKILIFSSAIVGCVLFIAACHKIEDNDSIVRGTSVPFIVDQFIADAYVYGQGSTSIYSDIPDVVAIVVDTVSGFEGGYGGKTGMDTVKILKSDITGWPDTMGIGGKSITFEKFNRGNFRIQLSSNIVIAGPIANPGPTPMEGFYLRAATGFLLELKRVFDGVYVIDNPGGSATVPPNPYLLYNYKNSSGGDSLAFPVQTDLCGGGLQLVNPGAPAALTSAEYTAKYPPSITSTSPLTLSWRVYAFSSARSTSVQKATCSWGAATVRTFEKQ